ncbi:uncharacterized protein C8orf48 homolog isoform X2 [Ascaphus truei]|uniref:uncharacterized protein C8orf48 homolog isoform X2 n=1 Tax=Ascaphus truei TaxID=8439 RepID=UPI003F5A8EBC
MARASDNIDCSDNEESLIQTRPISRGSDYSYDLFDSFTDGSSGEEESDSFETFSEKESDQLSLSETASSKSEIVEDTSGQLYQARKLFGKWIEILEDRNPVTAARTSGNQPKTAAVTGDGHNTRTETAERQEEALQLFCSAKIRHIRHPPKTRRQREPRSGTNSKGQAAGDVTCLIPNQLLNRLQLENIRVTVKQVTETRMHQPSTCPDCCTKQAELAMSDFLGQRRSKLEASLLREKMEEHLYSKRQMFFGRGYYRRNGKKSVK